MTLAVRTIKRLLTPSVILLIGAGITAFIASDQRDAAQRIQRTEFERRVSRLNTSFSERFGRMDTLLRGGRGLWLASEDVETSEWTQFLNGVGWNDELPELRSFGFLGLSNVTDAEVLHGVSVQLVEPRSVRQQSLWQRVIGSSQFRSAIQQAIHRQHLVAYSVSNLLPEGELGEVMFLLPVYRQSGQGPPRPIGCVFLSFDAEQVLEEVMGSSDVPVRLRVSGGDSWHVGDLAYMARARPFGPVLVETCQRQLALEYFSLPLDPTNFGIIWGLGLLISACVAALVDSLSHTREQATKLADRMTQQLRQEQRVSSRLAKVAQQTQNPVFMVDRDGKVGWMNLAAERACHVVRTTRLESIYELLSDPDTRRMVQCALEEGRPFACQTEVQRGPTLRVLDLAGSPVQNDDETTLDSVIVASDVTEHFARQTALEQARVEAERTSKLKSEFLASVSHEIRTPMNGIIGMAQVLSDELPEGRDRDTAATILNCGQSLLGILNDVLDFSKIESGHLELESTEFDLRGLLEDALAGFATVCRQKPLHLLVELDLPSPAMVKGDPLRVRQILNNLVSNAVKFTQDGSIRISAGSRDQSILLTVQDTGLGIPESIRSHIVQPFRQADGSTTRRFGGTGLGLSICNLLVQRMGGRLWFESEVGVGSTFFVELPMEAHACLRPPADATFLREVPEAYRRGLGLAIQASGLPMDLVSTTQPVFEGPIVVGWRICGQEIPHPIRVSQIVRAMLPRANDVAIPREAKFNASVLLVDDNEVNLKVGRRLLERCGCDVTAASCGLDALELLASERFDIVFMDIEMPDLDGVEVARVFRERESVMGWPRVPIIALTARALGPDEAICREVGMDDYITKPVVMDRLRQVLREHGLAEAAV